MVFFMSSLLLKDVPEELHNQLKEQANIFLDIFLGDDVGQRRLLSRMTLVIELPPPVHLKKPLSAEMLTKAREEGRA